MTVRRGPIFGGPSMIGSLPANLVRPPKPASPRRTGSGGNTGNALAVHRGQARQSGEPAFAAPLGCRRIVCEGLGVGFCEIVGREVTTLWLRNRQRFQSARS